MYQNTRMKHVGFISTRFHGTDGVSMEAAKWVEVFENMRFDCYFFSGLSDWNPKKSMIVPEAFFGHPRIKSLHEHFFGIKARRVEYTEEIHAIRKELKEALYRFIRKFDIDLLIIENAISIPLHIPLGLAVTELITETNIPAVGHHHDFYWERERFMVNCVNDYITMAFPPSLNSLIHVVINSEARKMLSYRRGLSSYIVPNVFNYDQKAPGIDDYNKGLKQDIGLEEDDLLFLQPTRIIQRKGIESAIEMVHRLNNPKIKLVITHSGKDEGTAYYNRIISYADLLKVPLVIRPEKFGSHRSMGPDGEKIYSIWDIYPHADLVTYPSSYEGFGNAFLEAVFFRKPVLVNRYSIYQSDIEPLGFDVIAMNHYISNEVLASVQDILRDEKRRLAMVDKNYELASRHFSYEILVQKIKTLLLHFGHI